MDSNHLKAANLAEKVYKTSLTTKSHFPDDELLMLRYYSQCIFGGVHHPLVSLLLSRLLSVFSIPIVSPFSTLSRRVSQFSCQYSTE
jgi:hypothetical protein